jgi:hypothetical protein
MREVAIGAFSPDISFRIRAKICAKEGFQGFVSPDFFCRAHTRRPGR